MDVIKDHPTWWVRFVLDGFGAHFDHEAMEIFATYKIMVLKEEGNMSHVNQLYDQDVAKTDKSNVRCYASVLRNHCQSVKVIDQWTLVSVPPPIHACINTYIYICMHVHTIDQSTNQPINQSINQSINLSLPLPHHHPNRSTLDWRR